MIQRKKLLHYPLTSTTSNNGTTATVSVSLTEAVLIGAHFFSISALHSQHTSLSNQNATILKLSGELSRLNEELVEMKMSKASSSQGFMRLSESSEKIPFFDLKTLAGLICITGICYMGYTVVVKVSGVQIGSAIKSVVIPAGKAVKSSVVAAVPFLSETKKALYRTEHAWFQVETDKLGTVTNIRVRDRDGDGYTLLSEYLDKITSKVSSTVDVLAEAGGGSTFRPSSASSDAAVNGDFSTGAASMEGLSNAISTGPTPEMLADLGSNFIA